MTDPVRTAIVAILSTIPAIGRVHAYERRVDQKNLAEHYGYNGQLRGWFVRRAGIQERLLSPPYAPGPRLEITTWLIRGYLALADAEATELAFDELIEAIRDAFRADDTLGGVVETCRHEEEIGIQLDQAGPVSLTGMLCHSAQLRLTTVRPFLPPENPA